MTYHGGRNDSMRGQVCAMTMGEHVGTWNVFRWGGEGSAWNVPASHLPLDAQEWLRARR
jgi:hypothetical protein